jgi:hypothetical protein
VRAVLYEGGRVHADQAAQDCTALTGMKKAAVALAPANSRSSWMLAEAGNQAVLD